MMQRKKLKSMAMFLATISTSLFIPLTVNADSAATITESGDGTVDCSTTCPGHTFTGSPGTIKIAGGKHKIILNGVTIDAATDKADVPAIEINKSATTGMGSDVEIELQGTNTLISGSGYAGLYVPSGNSVKITGSGSLSAKGGDTGAGIGSQGLDGAAGEITIATTVDPKDATKGKVTAEGGLTAAGIGGGQGGGCGKVTIISGIVDARGGSGGTLTTAGGSIDIFGGAGIGGGGGQREGGGGEIVLKGGDVTAIGGPTPPSNERRNGIDCKTLSSDGGSANIYSNSTISTTTNIDRFNGVVWMLDQTDLKTPNSGQAYGNAILNKDLGENTALLIRPGCSVTIPSSQIIHMKPGSSITGDKDTSIINADNIVAEGLCTILGPQLKVSLSRDVVRAATPNLVYTGKDLTDQAIIIDKTQVKNDRTYIVVDDGWKRSFQIDIRPKDCILEAGTYRVTYENPNYTNFQLQVTVEQKELTNDMIGSIDNEVYTEGKPCTPSPVVTYNNMTLEETLDYQPPTYENNDKIGTASLTIEAVKNGNYKGTATKEFTISRASLSKSVVTIKPESGQYNTKKHNPQITVTLEGKTLKEGDDYTITPSTDDFTSAGTITYSIEGAGNYAGSAQPVKYTITRVPITINLDKELKAESREYDGTPGVKMLGIEFNGILPGDEGEVELKTRGIVESANVGTYTEVTLANLELTGKKGGNYKVDLDGETKIKLSEPVEIWKKTPKEAPVTCTHTVSPTDGSKFLCTVEVPLDKGVDYLFAMDSRDKLEAGGTVVEKEDGKEVVQFTYDGIEPGSTHTFYVRSEATDNVEGVEIGSKDHEFTLLARDEKDKPGAFTLTFAPNPADPSLFIATIPPVEGAEYSFDGENFSSMNTKTDCKPLTEYTGYIRYAATAVLKAGESVSDTRETPAAEETTSLEPRLTRIDPNAPDESLVPPGLKNSPELGSMDAIIAKLTATLSAIPGYTYERMAFYDLTIYVKEMAADGTINERPAEAADFQNGGLSISIAPPDGTSTEANDFVVAHMFGETVGENLAGSIETPSVSKTANGLTFTVKGTSPIAVAWKEATTTNPGGDDNPGGTDDPNGNDPNTPGGDGSGDGSGNGNGGDLSATAGRSGADGNSNGSGDGTNGSGTGTEGDASALDALKEAIASLAPKTGDTNKIIMWIVIAVACIAVITGVKLKLGKGKKGKTSGTAGTKTTKASKSPTTTKKTGTSKPAATVKKTGNTKSTTKKTTSTSNSKKK